jgi:hypothetical protein
LIIEEGTIGITTSEGATDSDLNSNTMNFNDPRSSKTTTNSISSKGLKAGKYIEINNARINLDTADDGIHSDDTIIINSGEIFISSGDDGISADNLIEINSGNINIDKSVEGIEGKNIYINNGTISVTSSDDGINVADSSGETMRAISGAALYITGGDLYVNANGDGLDSNGDMYITGGYIVVDGPTNNGNGGLDCNGELFVNGGHLMVVGSSGMAETPGKSSEQNSISIIFSDTLPAGTNIEVESVEGKNIFNITSAKLFQSFVGSSKELTTGETYNVYINKEFYQELTISSIVTQIGVSHGMGDMGTGGRMDMNSTRSRFR